MEINLELLKAPLPEEAISQHPTKTYLSSIKATYVTERFTEVFGVGKWTTKVIKEHLNEDTGMVVVKVIFEVPDLHIYYESYGGNDNGGVNNKNFDLGDAYKGATTDGLTKIGSYLGIGIDVFKGKNNNTNTKSESKEDDLTPDGKAKEWLNEKSIDKIVVWAKQQGFEAKDLRKWYKISKPNFEILTKKMED